MKRFDGTSKEIDKYSSVLADNSVKCKCGKNVAISSRVDRVICSWCGFYVYRTKEIEFKYKMQQELKNARKQ